MKKVSVVIPVYKVEQYVASTVQSVLNQTYPHFEIILVDDGSPDRSIEICQQFTDPRIKIVRQENRGVSEARNNGIRYATGDYVAFLDSDDLWEPEKLAKHVEHFEQNPTVGVSYSRCNFIDEADRPLGIYQMSKLKDITPLDILCRTPIGNGSAPVMRREVLEAIKFSGDFYGKVDNFYFDVDRELHPSEDVECWLRIALTTPWQLEGIPEPLTLYRVNSRGFSANLYKKLDSWKKLLEKARAYAPVGAESWEKPAMAYQLRYLARRAVTLKDGKTAVKLAHEALATYWQILFEEPRRTGLTLAAAYSLWLLPQPLYQKLESFALNKTGASHKRRISQDMVTQTS